MHAVVLVSRRSTDLLVGWATSTLWRTELETVLELAWDELERSHASGAGGLSPLGLLTPVVCEVAC